MKKLLRFVNSKFNECNIEKTKEIIKRIQINIEVKTFDIIYDWDNCIYYQV